MSCSLPVFASVQDVNRVISILSNMSGDEENSEGWKVENDNWDWNETESEQLEISHSWLQECCISLSPSNDTLAVAKDDKAVFLASKWNKPSGKEPNIKYEISWSGCLALEEGECIADVMCIPLASQHKSSQGSPDWTCIVVGFTSGYIRIYLQNGSMLLSQFLHDDPVLKLKCRTWQPHKNYGSAEQVEELAILYPRAMVIIDGFSLYQSLRACRNQLARAKASGSSELIGPPPLAYKKWRFDGQKYITDIASCGVVPPNMFDRLQRASFLGGFNASVSGNMPAMSHYVATGMEPFVAVYMAVEGSSPALISDVALAVASKLTSAVLSRITAASGWLGWGTSSETQAKEPGKALKPKVEKGTTLPARFGLPDTRRHGNSITLAPNGRLAVTTDDFGRVMLLDAKQAVVVRIWKGYRDAECGWVMVTEENHQETDKPKTSLRTALFLVIYATRRGILEIWRTEQGPRVAAFNVGKDCRLLYAGHGIMGLGHVIKQGQAPPQHTLNCTLIQGDGTLKTFSVPFHCALSDKHSKRVRDLHLLKNLTSILDETKLTPENGKGDTERVEMEKVLLNILSDIQTPQLHHQGLQCVLSTVGIPTSVLLEAVITVTETTKKKNHPPDDQDEEGDDTKLLLDFCKMQKQLIQTHESIRKLYKAESESLDEAQDRRNEKQSVASLLGMTKSEVCDLLTTLEQDQSFQHTPPANKSFESTVSLSITSFLGCFEFASVKSRSNDEEARADDRDGPSGVGSGITVAVRRGLSSDMTLQLASFLFKMCLMGHCPAGKLAIPFDSSGINPQQLMNLLLSEWLLDPEPCYDAVTTLFHLHSLISTISSFTGALLSDSSSSSACDDAVSPWWENIRHSLAQSTATRRALSLAVVCRAVAMEISTASRKVEDEEEEAEREELASGDWVSVSVEIERWNLLVCQLTDLQALARFIANLTIRTGNEKNALDRSGSIGISVVDFLSFGQGAASKVLSQFITQFNIPASHLGTPRTCALKKVDSQMMSETGNEDQPEVEPEPEVQTELEGLGELRLRFPHSLNQDVLWCHCVMALVSCWNNNKEETNNFFLALEHLRCIHSPVLQNGLAVIIWKRYLKDKISATVMLMEKVGKAPKDRLCRKTVDLSYVALEQLIKATLHLLELIVEIEWADSEAITLETEDFWHVGETNSKSLVDEAQEQPPSNASLVELHAKLVTVLWIIIGLEMKSIKPLSLFDTTSKESFMRDFSCSSPVSASEEIDKAIVDSREKFLTRALSVTVSSMTTHTDNDVSEAEMGAPMKDWPAAIYKLAEQFGIDADSFKRHFVRELYSVGLDELAKESMLCVRDQRLLASQLLRIVGQRLAHVILDASESNERAIRLSRLPTQISSWIKTQDPSKLACRTVALSHTVDLLRVVMSLTPEDSPDYPLTSELADSMKFLL
ncbi:rab3 GTPase-activating protein non-catalytic subunit-like [Acropora millepora]|uniref:rab3 GTPase-activating protein non-catalytic subunit-like n=1 Tax=Acropora millepora TaxID=45264 RepID=UPI001CF41388|nr:rab3 GTPase-activating protein non-catalytic subunit-like [Acropora millepora]